MPWYKAAIENQLHLSPHPDFMQTHLLDVISILAASLMTGNELTVALFLHPTLSRLPDAVHAPAARAFAKLFGRVMPFWYALVFALSAVETWLRLPLTSLSAELLLTSTILWLLTIVFTVIFPVPLNNRIAAWDVNAIPKDWKLQRQRWDRLHTIRVVALLAALICLVVGILTA
jgi:uncharacterized membrane protein